ncbi:MAG TPA: hypothetical protein VG347_11745 [Verrucomicrobiae bacterium]|nr:hypothetical protein [Verrucomicrobiae bacterium]
MAIIAVPKTASQSKTTLLLENLEFSENQKIALVSCAQSAWLMRIVIELVKSGGARLRRALTKLNNPRPDKFNRQPGHPNASACAPLLGERKQVREVVEQTGLSKPKIH